MIMSVRILHGYKAFYHNRMTHTEKVRIHNARNCVPFMDELESRLSSAGRSEAPGVF